MLSGKTTTYRRRRLGHGGVDPKAPHGGRTVSNSFSKLLQLLNFEWNFIEEPGIEALSEVISNENLEELGSKYLCAVAGVDIKYDDC